jgi:hypothetical protein
VFQTDWITEDGSRVKFDHESGVRIVTDKPSLTYGEDFDPKFFLQFPRYRLQDALSWFQLAPWELPKSPMAFRRGAFTEEIPPLSLNDRCHHPNFPGYIHATTSLSSR